MRPGDNLDLATHLAGPPLDAVGEACFRAACGRAYYAAFVIARDELNRLGKLHSVRVDVHRSVIDGLKNSRTATIRGLGVTLDQLRATRHSADYEIGRVPLRGRPFDSRRANVAVESARRFVEAFTSELDADPKLGLA